MQTRHAELHQALATLAPPKRFELLLLVLSGLDRSVSQLASAVGLSQSCTTRHLQSLERAGLVKGVRDGKRVVFRPAARDAVAAGVLASLSREGDGGGPDAQAPMPAHPATAAVTPAVRSAGWTARAHAPARPTSRVAAPAPPAAMRAHVEPYSDTPMATDHAPARPTYPSDEPPAPPRTTIRRARQELEDFLL